MKRMDVITGRKDEKSGKTYWTRVGVAFERDKGGWSVKLDALPVNGELLLVEPKPREEQGARGAGGGPERLTGDNGYPPGWD